VHDAVPFVIHKQGETPDEVDRYDELSVEKGYYGNLENGEFIRAVLDIR
jgi:2,3-bisphosphoglycerate-independent phosphoglycerate mutase